MIKRIAGKQEITVRALNGGMSFWKKAWDRAIRKKHVFCDCTDHGGCNA